ncbi:MAG: hypothetical protein QXS20_04670 [Candidatus Thorarchaeota archaeon]
MPQLKYDHRVKANFAFDATKVGLPSRHPSLMRFTEVLWYGKDDEGYCVYKKDPKTGEVLRIDFLPP